MAANGKVFAMSGDLLNVLPEQMLIENVLLKITFEA